MSRRPYGYSEQEIRRVAQTNKIDRIVEGYEMNVFRRTVLYATAILHDKYDFKIGKCQNFFAKCSGLLEAAGHGGLSGYELQQYCNKKKIDTLKCTKLIPMNERIALAAGKKYCVRADKQIDAALIIAFSIMSAVLKETYRMSNVNLDKLLWWVRYYINSNARGYITDEIVDAIFILDEGYSFLHNKWYTDEERKKYR